MNEVQPGTGTRIHMQEVGTRDGLQMEVGFVPTDDKIALVERAVRDCGYAKIEVTSFVSPKAIPALRDAEVVMQRISAQPGVVYTALVPNLRGAERALACRHRRIEPRDVGQRDAQPGQPAHDARAVVRAAAPR